MAATRMVTAFAASPAPPLIPASLSQVIEADIPPTSVQLGFTIDSYPHFFSDYLCNIKLRRTTFGANLRRSLGMKTRNLALTKLIELASSLIPAHRYVDDNDYTRKFSLKTFLQILST